MSYLRPVASAKHIEAIQTLYSSRYAVSLTLEEAKQLLEGVMRLVYLTEVLPQLEKSIAKHDDATAITTQT